MDHTASSPSSPPVPGSSGPVPPPPSAQEGAQDRAGEGDAVTQGPGAGLRILKFGGSSVSAPDRIRQVAGIVTRQASLGPVVVVVSALGGVTNDLVAAASEAAAGRSGWREWLDRIVHRHREAFDDLRVGDPEEALAGELHRLLEVDLRDLLHGISLVREASPRTMDALLAHGELLSARLVALALRREGRDAEAVDARELLVTDDTFGNARILPEVTGPRVRARFPRLGDPGEPIPVVTGFVAATLAGETSTLGRGGSDYTAAVMGASLKASVIEIWTDVDGVMTADPRIVPNAFPLAELSYAELMELSHFGAKVVYPPTVHPARDAGIPLVIRNTFNPDGPGTTIRHDVAPALGVPIRGIASIHRVALLRVEGDGMLGVPGTAHRLFGALGRRGVNIILISQASSERSICLAVDPADVDAARRVVGEEFALEYRIGLLDELVVEEDCSILAVVGEGMRTLPGIAGRVFRILGGHGINIRAIAQGSSELNLSMVVAAADEPEALRAVHDAFFFPGVRPARLYVAGVGRVGEALLGQLAERQERLREERGFHLTLAGVVRRKKGVIRSSGLDPAHWRDEVDGGDADLDALVESAIHAFPRPAVFVDLTADDAPVAHYARLLREGVSVVTANKRGVSGSGELYRTLQEASARGGGLYTETTVGAGLPVLRTLADLVATGDRVERIEGVLSGTLSYLASRAMEEGPFSHLVREAHAIGFTEPDPRDDLSGLDVARKLVILARTVGMEIEPDAVEVEPLLPVDAWESLELDAFWEVLPEADAAMAARIREVKERGNRLVYLAEISGDGARVGLREVDPSHPCYTLPAGDNLFAIHSRHYSTTPLVIQGPGAGPDVTAAGVFADILRAAAESR
jgi:bifunctional aspartokinase / homoserine dehydrogenase 1